MVSTLLSIPALLVALLPLSQATPVQDSSALPYHGHSSWAPRVLEPNEDSFWRSGARENVTWDLHNAPSGTHEGKIYLEKNDIILYDKPGTLAEGFDLLQGSVEIVVPNVTSGIYRVVLIGDSGDDSQRFLILGD